MRARRHLQYAPLMPPHVAILQANFLAFREHAQAFKAENEDWNRKRARFKKPRRWSKKRLLVPPGAKAKAVRPSGAQPCNENRLKHGKFTRAWQLFRGEIRSHLRAGHALIAYVKAVHSPPADHAESGPKISA